MITAVLPRSNDPRFELFLEELLRNPLIRKVVLLHSGDPGRLPSRCEAMAVDGAASGRTWNALLAGAETRYLLFCPDAAGVRIDPRAPDRLIEAAEAGAGIVYADYAEATGERTREHPAQRLPDRGACATASTSAP